MHDSVNNIRRELSHPCPMEDQVVHVWMNMAIEEDPRIRRHISQAYRLQCRKRMPFAKNDPELAHAQQSCGDRRHCGGRSYQRHIHFALFELPQQVAGKGRFDLDHKIAVETQFHRTEHLNQVWRLKRGSPDPQPVQLRMFGLARFMDAPMKEIHALLRVLRKEPPRLRNFRAGMVGLKQLELQAPLNYL
jgi:hypothetical protein